MATVLYLGNKNYSSWSLRPWLVLTWAGIPFEERVIPLGGPGYGKSQIPEVLAISPTGRVPGPRRLAASPSPTPSRSPSGPPSRPPPHTSGRRIPRARAVAQSVTCEMHSSFGAMRRDLSMNIRRRTTPRAWPDDTRADLARVEELWASTRDRFGAGGPFLFGTRTIADAFYAPVATRLRTYGVPLRPASQAYCEAIFADPAFRAWEAAAIEEPWTIGVTDAL